MVGLLILPSCSQVGRRTASPCPGTEGAPSQAASLGAGPGAEGRLPAGHRGPRKVLPSSGDRGPWQRRPAGPAPWRGLRTTRCTAQPRRAPGPAYQAQLLGLLWIVLGEAGVSELIRFLRFQCSPNPVSPAVIVTTRRFQPWQAVEDRRCGDSS